MEGEFIKFGKNLVAKDEFLSSGHRACQGCGLAVTIRLALKTLGKDTIIGTPAGCWSGVGSMYPDTAWRVPWMQTLFENSAAVMSGVESGFRILMEKGRIPEREIHSVAIAGDGATNDIGVAALSGALERGHNFLYICLDNEAYMNTGNQRSSATPHGASTSTTPVGKVTAGQTTQKKNMVEIVAAHDIPYVASACPSYFPLYEVEYGRYKLNVDRPKLKPVEEYLKLQGRFRHLSEQEIEKIQKRVNEQYAKLKAKATASAA